MRPPPDSRGPCVARPIGLVHLRELELLDRRLVQRTLDERGDVEEAEAAVQERRDGLLVGGVERGRRGLRLTRRAGERQAAEVSRSGGSK